MEIQVCSTTPEYLTLAASSSCGDVGIDACREQLLSSILQRLFQRRANGLVADLDLGDLVFPQEIREFAVGNDLRFPVHDQSCWKIRMAISAKSK